MSIFVLLGGEGQILYIQYSQLFGEESLAAHNSYQ